MKYFKIISVTVSLFIITNVVIAQNNRTLADSNAKIEVRSTENIVSDPSAFVTINPADKAMKMSSKVLRAKNKTVATKMMRSNQLQSSTKDVVKKYNRFPNNKGEKKNKK